MEARPRPPLRLSVDERVECAVQEAVRRALGEQRKTQEKELDALSDALQRSLAELAGERDRALRSLAAEEDKRHDLVEECFTLLGGELSCGDVSRLALSLDRIEQELELELKQELEQQELEQAGEGEGEGGLGGVDKDGQPGGRKWVLENLRGCLHARAAVQDRLRLAADEVATDLFEAEEDFATFEPGFGGRNARLSSPICPPPPYPYAGGRGGGGGGGGGAGKGEAADVAAGSVGVSRARAAASEALRTSITLARERVDYLEGLAREVRGEPAAAIAIVGSPHAAAASPCSEGGGGGDAEGPRRPSGGDLLSSDDRSFPSVGGVGRGTGGDGVGDGAEVVVPADGSSPSASFDQDGGEGVVRAGRTRGPVPRAEEDVAVPAAASTAPTAAAARVRKGSEGERAAEESERQPQREEATAGLTDEERAAGNAGGGIGGGGRGVNGRGYKGGELPALGRTGRGGSGASDAGEARRWRMASRRAEASLADLRETLGDALSLSFQCGKECARRGGAGGGAGEEEASHQTAVATVAVAAGNVDGRGGGDSDDVDGFLEGGKGRGVVDAAAADAVMGDAGACCGGKRCLSCEARVTAAEELLKRLQTLFSDQGNDVARLATSLDLLTHRPGGASASALPGAPRHPPPHHHRRRRRARGGGPPRTLSHRSPPGGGGVGQGGSSASGDNESADAGVRAGAGTGVEAVLAARGAGVARRARGSSGASSSSSSLAPRPSHSTAAAEAGEAVAEMEAQSERGLSQEAEEKEEGEGEEEVGKEEEEGEEDWNAAPGRDMRTEWEELEGLDTYLAHYRGGGGLGSPTVQGVLDRWINVSKRRILEGWLAHVVHGGPVDAANGCFVPRVQISSLSKEVRDGLVSVVLPLLLGRRGVLLQVLTRERVELVHDIQIRVTPVAGRRDASQYARTGGVSGRRRPPVGEREHGARIRDMVMKAAHVGYVEEDEGTGETGMWRTPLASVDSLSRQLKDTWENFNANLAAMGEPRRGGGGSESRGGDGGGRPLL